MARIKSGPTDWFCNRVNGASARARYLVGMADTKTISKDDFHRERSRFLDAFAALEETLSANPKGAKDESLTDRLQELRAIRNDLVHSQLRFISLDGQLQALAINAQHVERPARPARVLQLDDFKGLNSKVGHVRSAVEKNAVGLTS